MYRITASGRHRNKHIAILLGALELLMPSIIRKRIEVSTWTAFSFFLGTYFPLAIASLSCLMLLPSDHSVVPLWLVYSIGWNLGPLLLVCLFTSLIEPMASHAWRRLGNKWSTRPLLFFLFGGSTTLVGGIAALLAVLLSWRLFVPFIPQSAGWVFSVGIGSSVIITSVVSAFWIRCTAHFLRA